MVGRPQVCSDQNSKAYKSTSEEKVNPCASRKHDEKRFVGHKKKPQSTAGSRIYLMCFYLKKVVFAKLNFCSVFKFDLKKL